MSKNINNEFNRLYGYKMDDVNGLIESLEETVKCFQDMPSVIDPDKLSMCVEDSVIRETEGTSKESLGYDECFDKIERELDNHVKKYKYYLLLHRYYSRLLDMKDLIHLNDKLKELYSKHSFIDYLKEEATYLFRSMSEDLANRLSDGIDCVRDFRVSNYGLVKELDSNKSTTLIQFVKMRKALEAFYKFSAFIKDDEVTYKAIMKLYYKS